MTSLLHMRGGASTTPVTWDLRALGTAIVIFDGRTLPATRVSAVQLDAAWSAYGLRGAANLFSLDRASLAGTLWAGRVEILDCTDPALVANVLGRARSNLLLACTPLVLEPGFRDRSLASDDRRLVTLVRGSRHTRLHLEHDLRPPTASGAQTAGIAWPDSKERFARLKKSIELMRRLWSDASARRGPR